MATNESSVVAALVSAQRWASSEEGRAERKRAADEIGKLRDRCVQSVRAERRLRLAATESNAGQVLTAMRAHVAARTAYQALVDAHLGQLYGFPVSKADMDHMLAATRGQFDQAEHWAQVVGVDGKDGESLKFEGGQVDA